MFFVPKLNIKNDLTTSHKKVAIKWMFIVLQINIGKRSPVFETVILIVVFLFQHPRQPITAIIF